MNPQVKWTVTGYAMVPIEVEMVVEAATKEEAEANALKAFKADPNRSKFVVPNSSDETAAHDWRPHAEQREEKQ